jgi:GT2 family glycosyltransferase
LATLECLARLKSQILPPGVGVTIILVDDGSTDGTAAAVADAFPDVQLIDGPGNLYWNGGMRRAFDVALEQGHDGYVLLNDDTHLESDAIGRLVRLADSLTDQGPVVVVGSTRDPQTGELSYGGWRRTSRWLRNKVERVPPGAEPRPCDTFNANCVLIGGGVAAELGSLDAGFTHGMGDFDYGFRAADAGFALWVAPGFVGTCAANPGIGLWVDKRLPLQRRWRLLLGPKGLPPREWWRYCRRHAGLGWPFLWLKPYLQFWINAAAGR